MGHDEETGELIRPPVHRPGGSGGDRTVGAPAQVTAVLLTTDQKIPDEMVKIWHLPEKQQNIKDYFFSVSSAGAFTGWFPFLQR